MTLIRGENGEERVSSAMNRTTCWSEMWVGVAIGSGPWNVVFGTEVTVLPSAF